MELSKKRLSVNLVIIILTGLLVSCGDKTPADQALKEAYPKIATGSYNYEGEVTVDIKADDSALVGIKGGLSEEEAQQELQVAEELKGLAWQQTITTLQNGKITFHGAVDGKNLKLDTILSVHFDQDGVKAAIDIPIFFDLKDEPVLYIDPKAGKTFNTLPPQLENKLIKFTLDDIPDLTDKQKIKIKQSSPALFKKLNGIINHSILELDARFFKDVMVSEAARDAGATRTIRLTLTPEQSEKISHDMWNQIINVLGKDFDLTTEQITKIKTEIIKSNVSSKAFTGDSIAEYSLNKKGQIVHTLDLETIKGAQHEVKIRVAMTLKDFDNPVFTVDPSKQNSMTFTEVTQIIGITSDTLEQ